MKCKRHKWTYMKMGWGVKTYLPFLIAMFMKYDFTYFDFVCSECGETKRIIKENKK